MRTEDAWWTQEDLYLRGYEGEGDGGDGGDAGGSGGSDSGAGATGGADGGGSDSDDADDDAESGDDLPDDHAELKGAIKRERVAARQASKEARALKKQLADAQKRLDEIADKDKSASEKATAAQQRAEEKVSKLAAGLLRNELNARIEREARALKFIDIDDALTQVNRALITAEQDPDDPSDITIDDKTVKAAVKALADKKKHLVRQDEDGESAPTGGSGYRRAPKGSKEASEDRLKGLYPSLR